jgi:hypothetical protein
MRDARAVRKAENAMARQSATPKSATPSRPRRKFTLQQANATLPLVKRIVGDIVRSHGAVTKLHKHVENATGKQQTEFQSELERTIERLQEFVDELAEIGCELKDFPSGLVDFIGRHQGRDVCLCWKLGEERIAHWHEIQTGFAGRQSITTLHETE